MNDVERLARVLQAMDYDDERVRVGVRMARGSCLSLRMDIRDLVEAWAEEKGRETDPVIDALTIEEHASFSRVPPDLGGGFTDWDKAVIAAVARRDGDSPYDVIKDAIEQLIEEFDERHPRRQQVTATPPRAELVTMLSTDERARLEQIAGVAIAVAPTGTAPQSPPERPQQNTLSHIAWEWTYRQSGLRGPALRSVNHWLSDFERDIDMDTSVQEITPAMIRRHLGPCRSKEQKARAEKALAVFRQFFDWCTEQGHLQRSPLADEGREA